MKLSPRTIFILFLCLGLAVLSFGYFQHWMPNKEEAGFYRDNIAALEVEAAKMPAAKKRREKAMEMVEVEAAKWQKVVAAHTPPASVESGGINPGVHAWQLTVDSRKFRNSMQIWLNRQLKQGGVKVVAGPQIPFPDEAASTIVANYFNYPAIPFPVVIFDLGAVTVQGTYEQIAANVRAWSKMPNYLAVADGLRLDGTSPVLTGTYNLTIVGYINGNSIFPAVPEGGGTTTQPGQQPGGQAPGSGPGAGGPRGKMG